MDRAAISSTVLQNSIVILKNSLTELENQPDHEVSSIFAAKTGVLARYRPIFAPRNLPQLTAEEFKSFLLFQNNKHWNGLHQNSEHVTQDMSALRGALTIMVNKSRPIAERLDRLQPMNGNAMVPYFDVAAITAILQVMYPNDYGVWNDSSMTALTQLRIWPQFDQDISFGTRYQTVNDILLQLSQALEIDLWSLDALFKYLSDEAARPDVDEVDEQSFVEDVLEAQPFIMERYLHEFLYENWNWIPRFANWALYEEDGNVVGAEYDTGEVGKIDLLARHKTESRWLVIELKRQQDSDETIGQLLRYMGWVSENLATSSEQVGGLIISHAPDSRIRYALKHTQNVGVMLYEIEFDLRPDTSQ